MLQHCWAQHVACVWPSCCDMLGVVGSNLTIFKFELITPNMSQHIATRWPNARNMLRPTMLRHVALACCDRLAGALEANRCYSLRTAYLIFEVHLNYFSNSFLVFYSFEVFSSRDIRKNEKLRIEKWRLT